MALWSSALLMGPLDIMELGVRVSLLRVTIDLCYALLLVCQKLPKPGPSVKGAGGINYCCHLFAGGEAMRVGN